VTPITHNLKVVKVSEKKSMLENFRANVLKGWFSATGKHSVAVNASLATKFSLELPRMQQIPPLLLAASYDPEERH